MRVSGLLVHHHRASVSVMRRSMATTSSAPLALVKELRELSGAPITDCKKALEAEDVGGDLKKAFEWLRKKGQASIAKSNRTANEGLVGVALQGSSGVIVEVNSETDFVARNTDFQSFVAGVAQSTLALGLPASSSSASGNEGGVLVDIDVSSLLQANGRSQVPIGQELADLVAKIRENIVIKRATRLSVAPHGIMASYVHNAAGPQMGTAAAIVAIRVDPTISENANSRATVEHFGKRLAMHVVAARPRFLDANSIPASVVDHERQIIKEQSASSGKSEAIIAKMTEGRLRKFLSELTLMDQPHMIEEGNPKVKDLLEPLSQELKGKVEVVGFVRYRCGEDDSQG